MSDRRTDNDRAPGRTVDRPSDHVDDHASDVQRNPVRDPDEWTTGGEPMTGPQESYLGTLAQEAGEDVDPDMTKAEASKKIDQLREKAGRGQADEP